MQCFVSLPQLYLHWANSVLAEVKVRLGGLDGLQDASRLAQLIDLMWPAARLQAKIQVHTCRYPGIWESHIAAVVIGNS